jgi:hypothetical protein
VACEAQRLEKRQAGQRGLLRGALLLATAFALLAAAPLGALETDQYLAWDVELEDSATTVNAYINREIEATLAQLGPKRSRAIPCEELPVRLYRHLFRHLLFSRLRRFIATDPRIDRFPEHDVGYWKYLQMSVFRKPAFPFFLPMARTVRIGDVRFGTDKFGHLLGFGRRYYVRFRRASASGLSEDEAMRKVIRWGVRLEHVTVGGVVDGVVSYADLEANFQGLMLARNLCEADPPHLVLTEAGWELERPVDLREYVTPRFDESYNENRYTGWRWKKVRPILRQEYCDRYLSAPVQERLRRYQEVDRPNLVSLILAEQEERRGRNRQEQSMATICSLPRASSSESQVASASR